MRMNGDEKVKIRRIRKKNVEHQIALRISHPPLTIERILLLTVVDNFCKTVLRKRFFNRVNNVDLRHFGRNLQVKLRTF